MKGDVCQHALSMASLSRSSKHLLTAMIIDVHEVRDELGVSECPALYIVLYIYRSSKLEYGPSKCHRHVCEKNSPQLKGLPLAVSLAQVTELPPGQWHETACQCQWY